MPVLPDKLSQRQKVRGAIASQFWEQPIASSRAIDGIARTLPCEPPPLSQTAPSGLSRSQQLLAAQALHIPALPAFDGSHGGLVLDRVLAKLGGRNWWTALGARARVQTMMSTYKNDNGKVGDILKNLNNYSLCHRTRIGIGKYGAINTWLDVPNMASGWARVHGDPLPEGADAHPLRFRGTLQHSMPGHELVATAAVNQEYVDSAMAYCAVPLAVSVDLASKDRPDGIQYRVGLHHASATDDAGLSTDTQGSPENSGPRDPTSSNSPHRSSLHFQGAVAVEGEAVLWKPQSKDTWRVPPALPASPGGFDELDDLDNIHFPLNIPPPNFPADRPDPALGGHDVGPPDLLSPLLAPIDVSPSPRAASNPAGVGPDLRTPSSSTSSLLQSPTETQPTPKHPAQAVIGDLALLEGPGPSGRFVGGPGTHGRSAARSLSGWSLSGPSAGGPQSGFPRSRNPPENAAGAPQLVVWDLAEDPGGGRRDAGGAGEGKKGVVTRPGAEVLLGEMREQLDVLRSMLPSGPLLPPGVTAKSLRQGMEAVQQLVDVVRDGLGVATREVKGGVLQFGREVPAPTRSRKPRSTPYSPFVSQPGVKVNAAVGCLARIPMPYRAFRPLLVKGRKSLSPGRAQSGVNLESSSQGSSSGEVSAAARGAPHSERAGNSEAERDVLRSESRLSRFAGELWAPYLRGTALRVFASGSITAQVGRFTRRFLDFSSLTDAVRLRSLTSPHAEPLPEADLAGAATGSWSSSSVPPHRHRAFALEGRGMWHAVSLSAVQQVFGPVRLRADARIALENPIFTTDGTAAGLAQSVVDSARSLRPSLLETVYGIDIVLPGSEGLARAALWYSPARREAMAEIRLL
eukprot:jgi/Botrbrau1/13317/Bobra.0315s0015.1